MGANIHYFQANTGQALTGLRLPHLLLCEPLPRTPKGEPRPEPKVIKAGRGLLLGNPRGLKHIDGTPHLILSAAEAGKPVGDDVRAMWSGEGEQAPRLVTNMVNGLETAVEGSVVEIGPRQYSITRRRQDDGTHLIHVRTGVFRRPGQTEEQAVEHFLAKLGSTEVGFHGSFALDGGAKHLEGVEESGEAGTGARVERLKWNVSRDIFEREDNVRIPISREDVWRVPEGCGIVVVDPSIGRNGFQRTFTVWVENGKLVTRQGGKRDYEHFMDLELKRLRKRKQIPAAHQTSSEG